MLSGVIRPDLLSPQFLVALAVSISISASAGDVKLNHLHKIRLKTSSKSIEISPSGSFKSVLFWEAQTENDCCRELEARILILDFFTCFDPEDLFFCSLMLLLDPLFWFAAANGALLSSLGTRLTLDQRVCLVTLQFSRVAAVAGGGSCCPLQLSPPANMRGILHVCVCVRSAAARLTVRRWFVTLSWRFEA